MRTKFAVYTTITVALAAMIHQECLAAESAMGPTPLDRTPSGRVDFSQYGGLKRARNPWHTRNITKQNAAEDLNTELHLVGMPRLQVSCFLGKSYTENNADYFQILGPYEKSLLEVQYTDDLTHVKQFRFIDAAPHMRSLSATIAWETRNLTTQKDLDTPTWAKHRDPFCLSFASRRFDRFAWRDDSGVKSNMLWDLLNSQSIIGIRRGLLHVYLGQPIEIDVENDREYFSMRGRHGCILPGPREGLEVEYKNDCVSRIRI